MVVFSKLRVLFSLSLLLSALMGYKIVESRHYKEWLACGKCSSEEIFNPHDLKVTRHLSYYLKHSQ